MGLKVWIKQIYFRLSYEIRYASENWNVYHNLQVKLFLMKIYGDEMLILVTGQAWDQSC